MLHHRSMTYEALPENRDPQTPCVVVAMHVWGVDEDMRACARRFADAGFAAAVPDLYEGMDAPGGDGETDYRRFVPFAQRLSFETVDPKIRAAAQSLRERFPRARVAIAGFCMGGIMALRRASGYRGVFDAAAVWYGALNGVDPAEIDVPVVASFGAEDASIPVGEVERFAHGLRVPSDVKIYAGAGHAFCDSTRDSYEAGAAEDSWARTLAFLRTRLKPEA